MIAMIGVSVTAFALAIWRFAIADAQHPNARAIGFFQEIARRYGTRPNLIYEIYNEPKTGYTWKLDGNLRVKLAPGGKSGWAAAVVVLESAG